MTGPDWTIVTMLTNASNQIRTETTVERPVIMVSIPHHEGTTAMVRRAMKKAGVGAITHNRGKIGEDLIPLKDKAPCMEMAVVVYHVACVGDKSQPCPARYIGETEWTIGVRFR